MADGSAPVLGVASCVGDRILTASADGSCRLYDAGTGQRLWSLRIGAEPVTLLRVLPDGTRFLAASGAVLALFEVESGRRLVEYRGHDAPLACLDISPDGRVLATGAADRSARLWDLATGNCQEVLTDWLPTAFDTERAVYAVLFHADGKALLTSAEDGVVRDYRLPECELIHSDGPTARIGRLAALPDGRQAVLMSKWSTSVQLLDLDSFERVPITPSIVGRMLSMDVSPDGALILACSTDGTTMLWSSDARDLWASVTGHSGPVLFAAFTPDGSGFLTASTDGIARIWPSHPAAAARARRPEVIALDAR
jgi:WD40 repeat protein